MSRRTRRWLAPLTLALFVLPLVVSALERQFGDPNRQGQPWWQARRDSSGQAPDPAVTEQAVVQVYAARAVRWRGIFGVHTWVVVKPAGARAYTRYEVWGFGVRRGRPAIRVTQAIAPDGYWFGSRPPLLTGLRGPVAAAAIDGIRAAVESYPYNDRYTIWPGPNSNTFVAHIGRSVPQLRLDMPPTAIGKDYIPGNVVAAAPSRTGYQFSLFGLLGLMVALEEGVEVNLLGLTAGVDLLRPALKLPGLGRVGFGPR